MRNKKWITLLVFPCLLLLLSCSRDEPIEKVPWLEKPPSSIALSTDEKAGAGIRRQSYFEDGITIKKEQVVYSDGSEAEIEYWRSGRLKKILERFPPAHAGNEGKLRRSTIFDQAGIPEIDQVNRPDGSTKAVSTSIDEKGASIYRTVIFYPDGKTIREIANLDRQTSKFHKGWTLRDLKKFRQDGSIESESARVPDGRFMRTVYSDGKKRLRFESWSPDRKMVRSELYTGDGLRLLKIIDENPNEMTVTSFNREGFVNHIHYWTPSIEEVTVYTDGGVALYRQSWSVPYGESEPKAKITRVEEIRGRRGKTSSYYFYPDGKTIHYIVERERKSERTIEVIYSFNANGSLEQVQIDGVDGVEIRSEASTEDLRRVTEIDPAYLTYRPYERPTSTLSDKPLPSNIQDSD
ncbi:MAG: hypothetical protein IPM23_01700 [Candidatus Melainabacteria bacterium]|nr:hypothetical protein [Candidatus Melainabacteria bacterium]